MGLNTALSGILGAQSDLNVISNNIANTNTTGFKASRAEFGDIFSSTAYNLSTVGVGSGTRLTDTAQLFNQGDIESTGNSLDVAIDGNGFFTLNTGNGYAYTRAGNFHTNSSGDVINAEGYNLQVYAPGATEGTFDTSHLINLSIPTSEGAAQATTSAKIVANLPSGATTPTTTPFSASDSTSYNNTTTFTAYDSQGQTHAVTMYYVKTGTNSWQAHAVVDGTDVTPSSGLDLTFDSNGQLSSPSSGKLALATYTPSNGASPVNITLDMSGSTQYGTSYSAGTVSQDGYQAGTLASIDIGSDGIVTANYSNGQDTQVGQLAMANFTNEQGLAQVGNTNWKATSTSGQAIMGTANSGQFGDLQSGSLESSTTADTTSQLVAMIQAQQAYQANAQVLSTTNTLTSTLMSAISR